MLFVNSDMEIPPPPYLPPSKINDGVTIEALLNVLKSFVCLELYILGDFNFSKIDWNNPNIQHL